MISISTLTGNAEGHLVIHEKKTSDLGDMPARVSRTKTLDGGVHIGHYGVSEGDRTFRVVAGLSEADHARLVNIYKTETFVCVAIPEGVFRAVISSVRRQRAETLATILIKEKETG